MRPAQDRSAEGPGRSRRRRARRALARVPSRARIAVAPGVVGGVFLGVGLAALVIGYVYEHGWHAGALVRDLYANFGTELIGAALTVLIIDALNRRRDEDSLKAQLVREMASPDNGLALRAVRELAASGWLEDGSIAHSDLLGADLRGAALEGADLSGVNLAGADLRRTNLARACLSQGNLSGALLERANLEMAVLVGAQLTDGQLSQADLALARLAEADLAGALLAEADLRGADLRGADLRGADLRGATMTDADLRGATHDTTTLWPDNMGSDEVTARTAIPAASPRPAGARRPARPDQ